MAISLTSTSISLPLTLFTKNEKALLVQLFNELLVLGHDASLAHANAQHNF